MAITDKTAGVWGLDQTYNKINQGSIWTYNMFDTPIFVNWGNNDKGQLAHNNRVYYSSPTQVSGSDYDLTQVSNFGDSNFVPLRKTDGTLWAVGQNDFGQLGQNNRTTHSSPVQVGSDTTWAYCVAVPGQSIKSTKTDGTLWAWGASYWGELANDIAQNTPTGWSRSSPVQIPGTDWDTGIRKHTGYGNSINAIKTDGTLWAWGYNAYGQLGNNNTTPYSSPIQVPGTTWLRIVPGSGTATGGGIKTDGTLWVWGTNNNGQLGQNNTTEYSSPKQVPGTTWVNGSFGSTTCYATKTDGTLWAWGDNGQGQLGHNNETKYSSPVQVGSGTDWDQTNFQGGSTFVSALKSDGTLWLWGRSNDGALGQNEGAPARYSSPVQIPGTFENLCGNQYGLYAKQTGSS